jgi:hypothetical protein
MKRTALEEIELRIAKKKELKNKLLEKKTPKGYVLQFIKNIEELNELKFKDHSMIEAVRRAKNLLQDQISSIDPLASVAIDWTNEDSEDAYMLCVDQVTITWSKKYQELNKCEEKSIISAIDAIIF